MSATVTHLDGDSDRNMDADIDGVEHADRDTDGNPHLDGDAPSPLWRRAGESGGRM